MSNEELIQQILAKHTEVSREHILESLEAEKEKTGGLIADETLLRLIAARYGIVTIRRRAIRRLTINNLVAGLNDVTVTGRVIAIYPPRTFEGKRSGKVANLMIADKGDTLGVVLWNDDVNLVESGELKSGEVVRFSHGYTREDREGKVELHLGRKSQVEVDPENVNGEDYPALEQFVAKIKELTATHTNIILAGTVKEVFPVSTFTRSDMSPGTVMRLKLMDETGEISIVAWNEKADELEKVVKVNSGLKLVNGKVKENGSGELEVHINAYTYVEVLERLDF
jgi:ssDNA-binding replication factor A large subunit